MRKSSSLTVTDQFCGAGGTSLGATQAGAEVVLALNHWELAVQTHHTNFPNTYHECTDISACNPRRYPSTNILLTSPECTNHSLAKGRQRKNQAQLSLWESPKIDPAEERSRATMLDVPRFAEFHQYELIIVENVVDARHWILFDEWLLMMQKLGYMWEIVYYNSMFAPPTPQSRDRMYVVFWRRGNPAPDLRFTPPAYCTRCEKRVEAVQSWKNPAHPWGRYGKNRQYVYCCPACAREVLPFYHAAMNAINWELPIRRIGDRKKPLKEKTIRRIEMGLHKFQDAFLLQVNKTSDRVRPLVEALPTQTGDNGLALVSPFLVSLSHGCDSGRVTLAAASAMQTQTTRQDQAVVVPYILDLLWEYRPRPVTDPLATVVAGGNHHGLVLSPPVSSSFLISYYSREGAVYPLSDPIGTVTTLDRHALVTPALASQQVEDCYFRMLQPSEIGRAMAFPENYVVLGTAREQVRQYGNAVTPPVMKLLLERCVQTLQ
ncbi:MAG: DNA cytosine methyltransferase [Ktedonobacteraceae bacterium]|nr:DNA cytosine methyltransferase [Ktedonobacteraceae bacterium]